jgi:hypothetical protein
MSACNRISTFRGTYCHQEDTDDINDDENINNGNDDTTDDNDDITDDDDTRCLETLRSEEGNPQLGGNQ